MVAVVQLVEHQVVILGVAGSSPVSHPEDKGRYPRLWGTGPCAVPGSGRGESRDAPGSSAGQHAAHSLILGTMRLRPLSSAALCCAAALALSACGDTPDEADAPLDAAPATRISQAGSRPAPGTTTSAAPTTTSTSAAPEPKKNCRDVMLSDTALRPVLGVPIVPLVPAGTPSPGLQSEAWGYLGKVADNHFDPCKELSWVTFVGAEGDLDNPDADRAFSTIVFFHRDELLTAPMPAEVATVVDVDRRSASELEITTAGIDATGESTATVRYAEGALRITSENPEDALAFPTAQLDVSGTVPPIAPRLYAEGNVYRKAYDQEIATAEGMSRDALLVDVDPSLRVRCVIDEQPVCQADDPEKADWIPGAASAESGAAVYDQAAEYHATQIRVTGIDPVQVEAVEEPLENVTTVGDVSRNQRVLFGGFIFDTTHNGQVRIYPSEDADSAAWISRTDYGVTRR